MSRRDDEIKTEIVNRIYWDTRIDAAEVLVEVENGLVSLMGSVSNSGARRAAFERAKEVRGVRIVDNQLTVIHPSNEKRKSFAS